MKIFRLLVDMDGVLVDFDSGACKAHGVTLEAMNQRRTPGEWNICKPLGEAKRGEALTLEEFWRPINRLSFTFWTGLRPLPWFKVMLDLMEQFSESYVVTAPSRNTGSLGGKLESLRTLTRDLEFDRMIPTPHKHVLAQQGVVLIDDRESTILNFEKCGGTGVLFPTLGNRLYKHAADPMKKVIEQLEKKKCI